jgi:hypothetical protein
MPLIFIPSIALLGAKFQLGPFSNGTTYHTVEIIPNWFWFLLEVQVTLARTKLVNSVWLSHPHIAAVIACLFCPNWRLSYALGFAIQ